MTKFRRLKRVLKGKDPDVENIPSLFEAMGFGLRANDHKVTVCHKQKNEHPSEFSFYASHEEEGIEGALTSALCHAFGQLQSQRIEPFVKALVDVASTTILAAIKR